MRTPTSQHAGPQLEIRLLGRFVVRRAGQEVAPAAFGGRLVQTLVRLLASRRGSFVSKDVLAEALWSEHPPADPAANIEVLVSRARRALGDPSLIVTVPGGYSFAGRDRCVLDAEAFVEAVQAGLAEAGAGRPAAALRRFREALDRWDGEPLAEDAYAEWAQGYRRALGRAHLEAVEGAAGAALAAGLPGEAVALAEEAAAGAPLREASHLLLVEALAASGDHAGALAAFAAFRGRLVSELGLDPSTQALDLERRVLRGEAAGPRSRSAGAPSQPRATRRPTGEIPFVGRRRELDRILSGVLGAGPAVAVVVGPSGSGKSRLLAEVAARSPLPVVAARAFLPEREEAWGLARTLLRELLSLDVQAADAVPELAAAALSEILPELAELRPITAVAIDPQSRRALTLQGAVQLVAAAAEEPLVVVDDLQWADASSLDLLQLAAQRVAGLRLVVAHRPEEVAEPGPVSLFLASLAELGHPVELRLGPLGADAVAELFEDEELVRAVVEAGDGSPLALVECLQALAEQGLLERRPSGRWQASSAMTAQLATDAARAGQERAVAARVARLPSRRRAVLHLLALLGREGPARLLARAAAVPEPAALEALDALARGRLARLGDQGWATAHDSITEMLARRLSAEERAPLHARLAEALRQHGADPAEVARHLAGAGDQAAAADAFAEAGRLALDRYANDEANGLVELALTEAGGDPRARAGALRVGAIVDLNVNRLDRSAERFDEALELFQRSGDARGVATVLDGRATGTLMAGQVGDAVDAFDRAANLLVDCGQLLAAASPRATRAYALVKAARPEQGLADADAALDLASTLGDPDSVCYSLLQRALALVALERWREAEAVAAEALGIAGRLRHREWTIIGHHRTGTALQAAGEPDRAEAAYRRGLELADRVPYHWCHCANALARLLVAGGELDAAELLLRRSLAEDVPLPAYEARLAQVELLAARGDPRAPRLARKALALAEAGGYLALVPRLRAIVAALPAT